ncbi:MAG: transposase [Candidatus Coprovivens sp.]
MSYSEIEKKRIIEEYDSSVSVERYVESKGISKTSFYKWQKIYGDKVQSNNITPIDITKEIKNSFQTASLCIKTNNIDIIVNDTYNEELLLRVIRSLKKL